MKASITISDFIGIIGIGLMVILFVTQIIPTALATVINKFSSYSAENVARQLSNLITVSGSATYKIDIDYAPAKDVVYQVSIDSRTIKVVPKFGVNYADKSSSTQYFAVNLPSGQYTDVNSFLVGKSIFNPQQIGYGESKYAFDATK
jgi:hypothetical protein